MGTADCEVMSSFLNGGCTAEDLVSIGVLPPEQSGDQLEEEGGGYTWGSLGKQLSLYPNTSGGANIVENGSSRNGHTLETYILKIH